MSKSTELDLAVKIEILHAVARSFDELPENATIPTLIAGLRTGFYSSHLYLVQRVGEQKALAEWLKGMPLAIPMWDQDILTFAVRTGGIPATASEYKKRAIVENYWDFMACKIGQLLSGYRIPKKLTTSIILDV